MASNRQFILLIFGVRLDEVRTALAKIPGKGPQTPKPIIAPNSRVPLIDYAHYTALPRTFTSADAHPRRTNLLCWHCGLQFAQVPRFIALSSTRKGPDEYEWVIDGNFCSWACAAAYIEEHYQDPKKWALLQNLAIVRARVDGAPICAVRPAPSRTKMRSYCGASGMTQQEFTDLVNMLSSSY